MKRIAYIIDGLYNSGGTERVLSVVANSLSKEADVTIVTLQQNDKPFFFPLDKVVKCHDLGVRDVYNGNELKRCLNEFFTGHHFDIVVSLGGPEMYDLHSIKDGSKKFIWFHFAIDIAKTTWIGPNPSLFRKIKAQLLTWKRIYHAKKYDKIIVISKADLDKWQEYTKKVQLIYNPITVNSTLQSPKQEKTVISVGRLDYQKGYDYLIDAWKVVSQKHSDWHLNIYGEGTLREQLQQQIDRQKLNSSITLCGTTPNITAKYAQHSIYVMSSRAEGLGLVLLEAAACGLPLISYDCPSGPSEIIEDGVNGYLIPQVGNVTMMADKICELIEDTDKRMQMGEKAKEMVEKFSPSKITEQWVKLVNETTVE